MSALAPIESNNPFSSQIPARHSHNAIAEAGQQREIAEVQAAMVIAKRFPRNQIEAMDKILLACTRPSLAEGALYSYSKGGTEVTGASIRLAEVAAQSWGNIDFGIRELEQRNGESTVEAFAWDLETNTRQRKVFQVPHVRHTKQGAKKLTDPRDIYELVANQGARRLRACILGVIPGDIIEGAVKQCEDTLHASADTSPDGLKKLAAAFEKFSVTREQIEVRIQRRLETILPAQVVQLKKVYASLRDGMSAPGDWFENASAEKATAAQDLAEEIMGNKPAPKVEVRVKAKSGTTESMAQQIHDKLAGATDRDSLDVAAKMISLLDAGEQKDLLSFWDKRSLEFAA